LPVARDSRWSLRRLRSSVLGWDVDAVLAELDTAEATRLRAAPESDLRGILPALLAVVRGHLPIDDPRRRRLEEVAGRASDARLDGVDRAVIVAAVHAARSAYRRELIRVRRLRNLLLAVASLLTLTAIAIATLAAVVPEALPVCFRADGREVCATKGRWNVALIEFIGATAACVSAVMSLRTLRGTSAPYAVQIAAAAVKLPTGALTAVLGLLLIRAGFVPWPGPLETPGGILACAVIFGYAQQLLTRPFDHRIHKILESPRAHGRREHATDRLPDDGFFDAVRATLKNKLAPPAFANYSGVLSVAVLDRAGTPVASDDEGRVTVRGGGHVRLRATIAPKRAKATVHAPILIDQGVEAPYVPFEIEIETDRTGLRREERVEVAHTESRHVEVTLPGLGDDGDALRIRLTQRGRLIQLIRLHVSVEGG
jgi:hypothetical protein